MDEVAGDIGLVRPVGLEVTQDAVLALAPEGSLEQLCEGGQAVREVGEPELAVADGRLSGCGPMQWLPTTTTPPQVGTT